MAHKTRLVPDLLRRLNLPGQRNKYNKRRQVRSLPQVRLLPLLLFMSILGGGVLSCGGDTTAGPPPLNASQAYWALRLNQHAVNMATVSPYNTIQLTATAFNTEGAPLSGVGPVTYTVSDSTVTVSPTGLVTAHYSTSSTFITASLQVQNVTLTDQVEIQITDTVPQHPLTTFSLQPAPGDSAKRAYDIGKNGNLFYWPVHATDAVGVTLCDSTQCALKVNYTASNPEIVSFKGGVGQLVPNDTGHVVLTATTWAYGVAMRDSVVFTVGLKLHQQVTMTLAVLFGVLTLGFIAPKKLIMGVGAVILFLNLSTHPIDLLFDQPAVVDTASCAVGNFALPPTGSGNIPAFGGFVNVDPVTGDSTPAPDLRSLVCRRFSVPGTYRYHSSLFPSDTYEIQIKKD